MVQEHTRNPLHRVEVRVAVFLPLLPAALLVADVSALAMEWHLV